MINEEKVKVMNKIALYEHGRGRQYLPISKFFRSDYIGLALIKNFFMVTIGYALILAAVGAYFSEFFMNSIHKMNLVLAGGYVIGGYVILLVVYTLLTYLQFSLRYYSAKKSVKTYYEDLTKLSRLYEREEKKMTGGRKK